MASRVASWFSKPGLLATLLWHGRLALRLLREPRVPLLAKAIPVLAVLYVLFPIDFVPDIVPVLGQLDDLGVALLALQMFLRMCPPAAAAFHRDAVAAGRAYSPMPAEGRVMDADFRRE